VQASSGTEDEEVAAARRTGEAYNISIYLMAGMPYLLLGSVTFLVWRGLKKNRDYLQAQGQPEEPSGDGPPAAPGG
jgi:hypothetical protein